VTRRMISAAAALLLLAGLTACSARHVTEYARERGWEELCIRFFDLTDRKQVEALTPASDNPGAEISADGITVRILQTVADVRTIYILAETTSENPLPGVPVRWEAPALTVLHEEGGEPVGGSLRLADSESEPDRMLCLYRFEAAQPLTDGAALTLQLQDLRCMKENGGASAVPGSWTISWPLRFADTGRTIAGAEPVVIGGMLFAGYEIMVSPFSVSVQLTKVGPPRPLNPDVTVQLRDGTEICLQPDLDLRSTDLTGSRDLEAGRAVEWIYGRLSGVERADEVACVSVCGVAFSFLDG